MRALGLSFSWLARLRSPSHMSSVPPYPLSSADILALRYRPKSLSLRSSGLTRRSPSGCAQSSSRRTHPCPRAGKPSLCVSLLSSRRLNPDHSSHSFSLPRTMHAAALALRVRVSRVPVDRVDHAPRRRPRAQAASRLGRAPHELTSLPGAVCQVRVAQLCAAPPSPTRDLFRPRSHPLRTCFHTRASRDARKAAPRFPRAPMTGAFAFSHSTSLPRSCSARLPSLLCSALSHTFLCTFFSFNSLSSQFQL